MSNEALNSNTQQNGAGVSEGNVKKHILLLTNRDSDNTGDQVIEASDIALINTIMKNLGIPKSGYVIHSRAAGIVSKKYVATKDPELLQAADDAIRESDVVVFGGAPLFNYRYQIFYERTATTLEIANKYNKPVIFSAVGIESYDEDNAKCQRLKKTLNFDIVKQITTRDGYEELTHYKENEELKIGKVADPAVFSSEIFSKFKSKKKEGRKKIGVFVIRANAFKDNGINFSSKKAAKLWQNIADELNARGYEHEFLTSGHFGDEAYMDRLIRDYGFPEGECCFGVNTPEDLLRKISSYDGIISCRLHPSIISYSCEVPAVSLVWNPKVTGFYDSIGYPGRAISALGVTASDVVSRLDKAMQDGVDRKPEYRMTIYNSLFEGLARCFGIEGAVPYTYDELQTEMVRFQGTSDKEKSAKLKRKFRRTYGKYNDVSDKLRQMKLRVKKQKDSTVSVSDAIRILYYALRHSVARRLRKLFRRK